MRQQGATGGVVMLDRPSRYRGDDRRRLMPARLGGLEDRGHRTAGLASSSSQLLLRRPADVVGAVQEDVLIVVTAAVGGW